MTQGESLPSPPPEKAEPPQYRDLRSAETGQTQLSEKATSVDLPIISCPLTDLLSSLHNPCTHNPTPTPSLDVHLSTPAAKSAVHSITTALDHATDGAHCTRCTANEAARTLTRYLFEMREAKKAGEWSKEDKKRVKVEMKGLMREVKGVVREEKARLRREGGGGR